MSNDKGGFSRLRAYLWPIHRFELRKFLPLLVMAFFIGFNYNILRNMKDALLITAKSSGAEVIPFIKVWGIVPGAFLMTFLYSRLNNRLQRDRVFYAMISIFLAFFALFTFAIYPLRDQLHPHETADFLQSYLPTGFKGLIAMFRYWTFSSFYIMSELWSSAILSMLFWGFANEVTRLGEAKRFYGLIAIGLNLAAISSGQVSVFLTGDFLRSRISVTENPWHQSIIFLTLVVMLSGAAIMGIYRYMTKEVLPNDSGSEPLEQRPAKMKMSMRENFALLGRSKYLLYVAIIVLAYNIVINLVEVIWKDQVRALYPHPNDFNAYMSQITSVTGVISFFTSLLVSGQLIRRFGWTPAALITPIILLTTSFFFFFFFFGHDRLMGALAMFGTSPLALVVLFGSMQNCLCRASKFTLFDSTKEMAFIPLSMLDKLKGKAAIDGVGSRLGKSGGSLIHQGLLVIFSTISASAHIVAGILFVVIIFWIGAVISLGKQFNALTTVKPKPASEPLSAGSEPAAEPEAELASN
ncbi:MAG: NTP/NDP exchange transporter [Chlamydiales bacterium]|nr:NTP/NDP exchange transporter [Chlamydiales bacterium]